MNYKAPKKLKRERGLCLAQMQQDELAAVYFLLPSL
jgi:hypothetical protein